MPDPEPIEELLPFCCCRCCCCCRELELDLVEEEEEEEEDRPLPPKLIHALPLPPPKLEGCATLASPMLGAYEWVSIGRT